MTHDHIRAFQLVNNLAWVLHRLGVIPVDMYDKFDPDPFNLRMKKYYE